MMFWLKNFELVSLHWLCHKMPKLIVHVLLILSTPFATTFLVFFFCLKKMNAEKIIFAMNLPSLSLSLI